MLMHKTHLSMARWCLFSIPNYLDIILIGLANSTSFGDFHIYIDYNAVALSSVLCCFFNCLTAQVRDCSCLRAFRYTVPRLELWCHSG